MIKLGVLYISYCGEKLDAAKIQSAVSVMQSRICGLCFVQAFESILEWEAIRAWAPKWSAFFAPASTSETLSGESIGLGILSRSELKNSFRVLLSHQHFIIGTERAIGQTSVVILSAQLDSNPNIEQIQVLSTLIRGQKIPVILAINSINPIAEFGTINNKLRVALETEGMCSVAGSNIFISKELSIHRRANVASDTIYKNGLIEISVQ